MGLRTYFQVSLLCHPIRVTSARNLRCSFFRLLSCLSRRLSRRLGGQKDLNSVRRVYPTLVSIIHQFSRIYLY